MKQTASSASLNNLSFESASTTTIDLPKMGKESASGGVS
jgi:hypothetical protein